MKYRLFISFVIVIGFQTFLACYDLDTTCKNMKEGDVCVTVKNRSGQNVRELTLSHQQGKITIADLANYRNVNLAFNSFGEGMYKIKVVFDNGKTINNHGVYVEAGYRRTEIIKLDTIESKPITLY